MSDADTPGPALVPISVLTGFLGSGKTTLLSKLIKRPEFSRTAVIVNEFGEISLDHLLVEKGDESVVQLRGGCLCCAIRGDLAATIEDLFARRARGEVTKFDRVVVETTGLADPAPILQVLMDDPVLLNLVRLDGVIATVDAVNGEATLDAHEEAVKQAAVADRLLLTKADLAKDPASRADTDALAARLAALNPGAPLIEAAHGEVDPARLFDAGLYDPATKSADVRRWLRDEAYAAKTEDAHGHRHHDVNRHDDRIRAFCITRDRPVPAVALMVFMEALTAHRGPDILRVKGIVNVKETPERPAVIHGVQHVFHPLAWLEAWPDDDRRTRIVCITRDIERESLEGLFDVLDRETGG
ncbi:MAG: GTP-binding protein [Rhodospirillaceae bacterium]|jgi:G3E family GTPase|nr:GTP-binding protein [Rhodospirillaceae bacterium]MBT6119479.1 GTP-binding protein [Rhodospirillaceae bacterium]